MFRCVRRRERERRSDVVTLIDDFRVGPACYLEIGLVRDDKRARSARIGANSLASRANTGKNSQVNRSATAAHHRRRGRVRRPPGGFGRPPALPLLPVTHRPRLSRA
jgi:hypothetical protein